MHWRLFRQLNFDYLSHQASRKAQARTQAVPERATALATPEPAMSTVPAEPPAPPASSTSKTDEAGEPKYGGYTRFELELEFVQSLGNPVYLNHLAAQKLLSQPAFVAYLEYLQYWTRPPYVKYLTYPGPTLRNLELLQQERFRQDIISPDLVHGMIQGGMRAAVEWHKKT
ncbi:hypothetical protein GGTG_11744 [Gaeumannomyces tritici R3-111a-1]|uniref:Mediator of RNA polymerase II transcription subunit 31 n=1 Tax=Gaeumannomyces tritici (strain R3-111a-1) TaxID=644352 RepID=J3PE21_GAET3|nr:hypothetical protein GGTG_11744 [Gaeumannomyces tritici R3-111a-1]EJT70721.1 hypothetical protein GGTG_11744 [Gaeumannomyces tritici R3-111a-1]